MERVWKKERVVSLFGVVALMVSWAGGDEKIVYSLIDTAQHKSVVYAMNTDASQRTEIFDFSRNPKDTDGYIVDLWAEKGKLYFSSDNNYLYGPARYNLFDVVPGSYASHQITPGEHSGVWGLQGTATVNGTVEKGNGDPYINAPVFLEGKGMVYTDGTGAFEFQNVAAGDYWLTAYRDSSNTHQSLYIKTSDHLVSGPWQLVPNTGDRWSCEAPRVYGNRIYYLYSYYMNTEIKYTDTKGTVPHKTVLHYLSAAPQCDADFDAFDIGQKSGKLLFIQYKQGPACGGIYTADKEGKNITQLVDMTLWQTVNDSPASERQIFWNSDETMFAMSVSIHNSQNYQDYGGILVFNASGTLLSESYGPASYEMTLYGWDAKDQWLLYGLHPYNDATKKMLGKIRVDQHGSIDSGSAVSLLQNANIGGAGWMEEGAQPVVSSMAPLIQYLLD